MTPAPVTIIKASPPCPLPDWPRPIALGGLPLKTGTVVRTADSTVPLVFPVNSRLITPDGLAEIERYVAKTTAFYDASRLCRGGK